MEKSLRPIIDHVREKAPAYALAVVVGVGSLALMGEGDGQHPGRNNQQAEFQEDQQPPRETFTPDHMAFEDFQSEDTEQPELLEKQ
jgi:hypothetical protein